MFRPVVYFVGHAPANLIAWLQERQVETRTMTTVIVGSPDCNRLKPFFDPHPTSHLVVTDTDLFVVDDPSCFLTDGRFRTPPNNGCNPPSYIFKELLAASGLGRPYRPTLSVFSGVGGTRETHINNVSAGVVITPAQRALELARLWEKWAKWLVEHRHLLDRWAIHVFQVSFALVMEEMAEDVEFLPPNTNVVLRLLPEITTVYAFHLTTGHIPAFPGRFNIDRTMVTDGLPEGVAQAIGRLNVCILEAVPVISSLATTRDHLDKFLNPAWVR